MPKRSLEIVSQDAHQRISLLHQANAYLDQNKLMQQDIPAHVRERDSEHDDQTADEKAFGPCFQSEAHRISGLIDDKRMKHHIFVVHTTYGRSAVKRARVGFEA
jgi:hypothetical protein